MRMLKAGFLNRKARPENLLDWSQLSHKIGTLKPVHVKQNDTMAKVIDDMHFFGKRRLPVTDSNGALRGIITSTDVLEFLASKKALKTPVNKVMSSVWSVEHWSSLYRTLGLFHRYRKGGYPLVKDGMLHGIITDFDIIKGIERPLGIKVLTAMTEKPVIVKESEPILHAARMMSRGFRRLPVTRNGLVAGVVMPHDIISHLKTTGKVAGLPSSSRIVGDIMATEVITINPQADVYDAIRLMKKHSIGGLPVTEDFELVGIITERDVVNLFRP